MSKFEKLDLMGVASLAAVAGALLMGWMVNTHEAAALHARSAAPAAVTYTHDGHMKLTVTADRGDATAPEYAKTRTASVRPFGGASLSVSRPAAIRL
ncbi:MAG: hypothetical protein IPP91_09945 [Betaproteobacteria bacterium]|nr:hypothetical protein [Betaproteobacteria bacterium]